MKTLLPFLAILLTAFPVLGQEQRALIDQVTGEVVEIKTVEKAAPSNPVRWAKVVQAGPAPSYDPATQHPPVLQKTLSADKSTLTYSWSAPVALTQVEIDARNAAISDIADRDGKRVNVKNAVATLRQWASDAQGVTVTTANNTAVTQQLVDRMAIFFDRFADLIEAQRLDQ